MIQKNKDIEIKDDDIFLHDKLNREESIKDLSQLLVSTHEPFVFSINASWGAGKTTFVKLWKSYLEKELDVHSIYFSAWEDDFSKEPLISIMGELNSYINDKFPKDKNLSKKLEELKSASGKIIKRGLPAFIKGATAGVLDLDKGVESAIGAVTESVAKELIDSYDNDKAITIKFKELLHDIIEQIDSEKPLVIFIDELDRCRPLYAIELLERLKHIFGIEKLIFVLSIDKKQLSESIKSQYGNIDTDNYLRRFIDLEYNLQNTDIGSFCDMLDEKFHFEKTLKSKGIILTERSWNYLEFMKNILPIFHISLREIEQIFIKLNIYYKTMKPRIFEVHFRVFIFLEILKSYDSNMYYKLINNGLFYSEIRNLIEQHKHIFDSNKGTYFFLQALIEAIVRKDKDFTNYIKEQNKLLDEMDSQDESYHDFKWYVAILEFAPDNWKEYTLDITVKNVIKKIEFADKFNLDIID